MIRVYKSTSVPASLLVENCSNYDGEDVKETLVTDQHQKCYLCETKTGQSPQIEHLRARSIYPELKFVWSNLFLTCGYCNYRKSGEFELLDPANNNIEDTISHRLDLSTKTAIFAAADDTKANHTVLLLDRLFNGNSKLRKTYEKILFDNLEREVVFFISLLYDYQTSSTTENKQKVIDSMLITKEFLAFKYWIIKDIPAFYDEFKEYMVWNKQ